MEADFNEPCDHRDDFGSTIWDGMCILCSKTIPLTVREAFWQLIWTLKAAIRR